MKVLVTGFEPFGKHTLNPSKEIVLRLRQTPPPGLELATAILTVHRTTAPQQLVGAFEAARPDAVLLLGEAGSAMMPALERVYVNLLDYAADLGGGVAVQDEPVRADGPPAYFSTLPVREILADAREASLPARLSLSAGTYICNQAGYVIRDHLERQGIRIPAGLIHVPFLPEQAAMLSPGTFYASMSLESQCRFVQVALGTIARNRPERV